MEAFPYDFDVENVNKFFNNVQYPGKHSKILATIFLLLPSVLNSRVSHYSGHSHFFPHTKLLPILCILNRSLCTIVIDDEHFVTIGGTQQISVLRYSFKSGFRSRLPTLNKSRGLQACSMYHNQNNEKVKKTNCSQLSNFACLIWYFMSYLIND